MSEKNLKEILSAYGKGENIVILYKKYMSRCLVDFKIKDGKIYSWVLDTWFYICDVKEITGIRINNIEYYNKKTKFNFLEYRNTDKYIYNTYLNYKKQFNK